MCDHDKKNCPRCEAVFECKMGSILLCHCSEVTLTEAQQALIAEQWDDCLCHECLQAISQLS